jgi:NAD(P)-dependent dehydrogenase (short-subunit alcohol dehydrogenase family)
MPSIFITGANRGLGFEFARQHAVDGWEVVATCRRPEDVAQLTDLGVEVVALDVTDFPAVSSLAARLGGRAFDVLLNNAGVYGEHQEFGKLDPAEWERVLRVNVIGPLKVAEAFLPHLAAGDRKVMAFLTSRMGSIGDNNAGGSYIYRSSKAALNAAVKSLAIDLRPRGIAAVVLHPGWVRTDMGGAGAPLEPTESVAGLRRVISAVRLADSGSFLDYTGASLPW